MLKLLIIATLTLWIGAPTLGAVAFLFAEYRYGKACREELEARLREDREVEWLEQWPVLERDPHVGS